MSTERSCATSSRTTSSRYWRQHTGHGIGLRNHEAPFLDLGDRTPLEPGMVFTVEPGLYDPAVGGFRHSDTVVVTEDGVDVLTDYPIDLESLHAFGVTARTGRRARRRRWVAGPAGGSVVACPSASSRCAS